MLTEAYSLTPDGRYLHVGVRLEIERAGDPTEFRLVYRPADKL
jgi:hypothetical protein